jgi:hypothetical protein
VALGGTDRAAGTQARSRSKRSVTARPLRPNDSADERARIEAQRVIELGPTFTIRHFSITVEIDLPFLFRSQALGARQDCRPYKRSIEPHQNDTG